jgi:hypothetical protein
MNLDETKQKYQTLITNRVLVEFKEFMPDIDYVFVIPFIWKQIDKTYDEGKRQLTGRARLNWYINFYSYFHEDTSFKKMEFKMEYWVRKNQLVTVSFSGYGFYQQVESCIQKELHLAGERDGIQVTMRRKSSKKNKNVASTFWTIKELKLVKYEDYPQEVKDSGVRQKDGNI